MNMKMNKNKTINHNKINNNLKIENLIFNNKICNKFPIKILLENKNYKIFNNISNPNSNPTSKLSIFSNPNTKPISSSYTKNNNN